MLNLLAYTTKMFEGNFDVAMYSVCMAAVGGVIITAIYEKWWTFSFCVGIIAAAVGLSELFYYGR